MARPEHRSSEVWKRWHDPRATERDYQAWRTTHREELRKQAIARLNAAIQIPEGTPVALVAAVTGLSDSTVRTYVRKRAYGKRGPLMTTYLALRLMNRKVQ